MVRRRRRPTRLVGGTFMAVVAHRGTDRLTAEGTVQAELTHQPGDGAARHLDAFTVQSPPDLTNPADAVVADVDTADVLRHLRRLRLQQGTNVNQTEPFYLDGMKLRKLSLALAGAAMLCLPALTPSAAWADPLPSGCINKLYTASASSQAWCTSGVGYVAAGVQCRTSGGSTKWFWGDWATVPGRTSYAYCEVPYIHAIASWYSVTR